MPAEKTIVDKLIEEFADCFALSMSEVIPVQDAIHKLNIPDDATFSCKVRQKPLTPPQRPWFHKKLDEMLAAGIIVQCHPSQVKAVSPTTLAQKAHETGGLTLDQIRQLVNEQLTAVGETPAFSLPPLRQSPKPDAMTEQKWRICQNFAEVNKVTQVAPMPQGDIRTKQQSLSGHRWVSVFDFASGFYACTVAEESRPYTAFYVEGRGYFWYCKMPFGLTGAPSTFAHMTAQHLHDLLTAEVLYLFVDDGGTAADEFLTMMSNLRAIFMRVRERGLSLSASKTALFQSEAVFAGATVGPKGVTPDLSKLTAIVEWPQPQEALALSRFLGLTGHFRDLVQNYAHLEGPLRDMLKSVPLPQHFTKSTYRHAMQTHKLSGVWGREHTQAFLHLKTALTSEPVLRRPVFDGTPFVITTDGCQQGFGAVLTQTFTTCLPNGTNVTKRHPIAFASKRTSRSEENYKPFLLEFAALKFGLDKFSNLVWGFPVEIETDCQALRDVLANDKLNATHARWRDGILAHHITDVRHIAGKINVVADGISRMHEGTLPQTNDGSSWSVCEDWETEGGLINDIFTISDDAAILRARFTDDPIFLEVIDALMDIDLLTDETTRRRARHRAEEYFIENGRLWRLRRKGGTRARARVECIPRHEARALAAKEHHTGGHWGHDAIKLALTDRIYSPRLDETIVNAIRECAQCKNFGATHLHALLQPITRRHPFELLVGDYLSLPDGKGGFHTVGLYLDTYSQHVWAFRYKTAGSAKTTVSALSEIFRSFVAPETFMSDGGRHFDNHDVRHLCTNWGVTAHIVSAYSPWVNGLVEGTNKLLLHVLKRLCAPGLGDDEYDAEDSDKLLRAWPDHLDEAVRCLNYRLLPAFQFLPKELLLGLVVNTARTPLSDSTSVLRVSDVAAQISYAVQQNLDGYAAAVAHALRHKHVFDRRVLASHPGEVIFKPGSLVQVRNSALELTLKTSRKMLPQWSAPRRIAQQLVNSYRLTHLDDSPISGLFSARRLRPFIPRLGSRLAAEQFEFEATLQSSTDADPQENNAASAPQADP